MNDEFIRFVTIGPDCIVDFKRVNFKYAISITEEMCTCDPFTGLFDLDMFFSQNGKEDNVKPYNNSRIYVPLRMDSHYHDSLRYFPVICTETGFIIEDLRTNKIVTKIISYDDVYYGNFDFDNEEKEDPNARFYEMLSKAGFDMVQINQKIIETGGAQILAKDIPAEILKEYGFN
jgi:hypothetical protein